MRRLIAAALVVALGACAGPSASVTPMTSPPAMSEPTTGTTAGPTASVTPSASAPASSAPSEEPPVGTLDLFLPGAAVEVAVQELNLRDGPSTSAKRLATLSRGEVLVISPADRLRVGFGPVRANGYHWYPVIRTHVESTDQKLDPLPAYPISDDDESWGWVASDDGRQGYLAAIAPRCPTTIDLVSVSGMLPAERLACFGEPFVLEGTFGCPICEGYPPSGVFKPMWLTTPLDYFNLLSVMPEEGLGPVALHFPPDGAARPANGSIVRVTVHVDDRRSTRCVMSGTIGDEVVAVDPRTAVLYCRERLVVDSLEALGPDPDFPG